MFINSEPAIVSYVKKVRNLFTAVEPYSITNTKLRGTFVFLYIIVFHYSGKATRALKVASNIYTALLAAKPMKTIALHNIKHLEVSSEFMNFIFIIIIL